MNPLFLIISVVLAYLIGAIPVAYIFGRLLKGIDIREYGSGNMGATNAFRVLGKFPGAIVLMLDIIKGIVPVVLLANIFGQTEPLSLVVISTAAVAGHNWTIFLGFKGGKGMATSLGVLIGLAIQLSGLRIVLLIVSLIWLAVFLLSGFVSLASLAAAITFPVFMAIVSAPLVLIAMAIILCGFVVFRHRPNIKRLFAGQEPRVPLPFYKKRTG